MKKISTHPKKNLQSAGDVWEHNKKDTFSFFLIWHNFPILGQLCVLDLHVVLFRNINYTCCSEGTDPPLRFKPVWIKVITPDIFIGIYVFLSVAVAQKGFSLPLLHENLLIYTTVHLPQYQTSSPDFSLSATCRSMFTICRDIHATKRMNPNNFGSLSFHLVPSVGQHFHLREISKHLLDGLAKHFTEMFMVPRGGTPKVLLFPWLLNHQHHEVAIFLFCFSVTHLNNYWISCH